MQRSMRTALTASVLFALLGGPCLAQGVTRQEFEELKRKVVTEDQLDEITDEIADQVRGRIGGGGGGAGTTSFLITGYATALYEDAQDENGTFEASFNPIFLWKLNDRLAFEAEVEFELEDQETETGLEYAQMSYRVCDYLTASAGKFLNPFGIFRERLHTAWINKLPDKPLGYSGGANRLVPSTQMGAQLRGSYPFPNSDMEVNYVVWVSNGPSLQTAAGKEGLLNFDNFPDSNQGKAVGGRIGFLPVDWLEVGGSYELSQAMPAGTVVGGLNEVDVTFYGFDLSVHKELEQIKGTVDVRGEVVVSDVDDVDYGGTVGRYDNNRTAYFIQVAYRPTKLENKVLKDLEAVVRVDSIDHPGGNAPGNDEDRTTLGLNWWMNESTVLKVAYRISDVTGGQDDGAFLMQWAMGF